jgi:lipopolysaccharide/colanic/teichoic acid biosynthesis glycosyltransferase
MIAPLPNTSATTPAALDGVPADARRARTAADVEILREVSIEPPARTAVTDDAAVTEAPAASRTTLGETMRRVVNVVFAALALIALAPLMTLIGIAVRLSSRGPVIYVQERVGLDRRRSRASGEPPAPARASGASLGETPTSRLEEGFRGIDARESVVRPERRVTDVGGRPYAMYKFRTMRVDAEVHGRAVWATRDDPRVTRVGRFLRRTRLDELPQLVNVLRGEMNVVGPRPERPAIAARLRHEVDGYALRYRVRPGITGWAQINHPYDSSLEDVRMKVRYDLEYLSRRSVAEDLRILARTVPVMLGRRTGRTGW